MAESISPNNYLNKSYTDEETGKAPNLCEKIDEQAGKDSENNATQGSSAEDSTSAPNPRESGSVTNQGTESLSGAELNRHDLTSQPPSKEGQPIEGVPLENLAVPNSQEDFDSITVESLSGGEVETVQSVEPSSSDPDLALCTALGGLGSLLLAVFFTMIVAFSSYKTAHLIDKEVAEPREIPAGKIDVVILKASFSVLAGAFYLVFIILTVKVYWPSIRTWYRSG